MGNKIRKTVGFSEIGIGHIGQREADFRPASFTGNAGIGSAASAEGTGRGHYWIEEISSIQTLSHFDLVSKLG